MKEETEIKPEHRLFLNNGAIISNLTELAQAFEIMDDYTFRYHLNEQKNDFYNWVKDIIKDQKLANDLLKIANQKQAAELVKKRIKEKEPKKEEKLKRKKITKKEKKPTIKKIKRKRKQIIKKKQIKKIKLKKKIQQKKEKRKLTIAKEKKPEVLKGIFTITPEDPLPKPEKIKKIKECTHYNFMQCGLKDFMIGFIFGAIVMAIIAWLLNRF